jgi:hypothetical protein
MVEPIQLYEESHKPSKPLYHGYLAPVISSEILEKYRDQTKKQVIDAFTLWLNFWMPSNHK